MEEGERCAAASAFLGRLWAEKPATAAIQVWEKRTAHNSTFADPQLAAVYASEQAARGDVYMAAGLALKVSRPAKRRSKATEVVGIPGLWADIDLNGGPEGKTGAAPDIESATQLAGALLEPTLLVNSGYGLQAWWLFDGPWIFDAEGHEREQAHRLSVGFQAALRAKARERGFTLDSTFDLARLMRLPGTLNHKGVGVSGWDDTVPVSLIDHDGPTYQVEQLVEVAHAQMAAAPNLMATLTGDGVDISINGAPPAPPLGQITELMGIDPEFTAVWNRVARPGDGSHSAYDLSIANRLVAVGCTDQEIAEAIRWQRAKHDPTSGKGERLDYLQKTIAKARSKDDHEARLLEREHERNESIEQLGRVAHADVGEVAPSAVVALFAKVVGGPEIKELIKDGRDVDTCRFRLVLADGRDVPLGDAEGLINQRNFRRAFFTVTEHLPPMIKATKDNPTSWDDVVRALASTAIVNEESEDTRAARVLAWVDTYTSRRLSTDRDQACQAEDPFVENGYVHIHLPSLHQWLRRTRGERLAETDVKQMLKAAGFEGKRLNYRREDGKRDKRWYWRAPSDLLTVTEQTDG